MDKHEVDIKMEVKIVLSKWSNKLALFREGGVLLPEKRGDSVDIKTTLLFALLQRMDLQC